MQKQELDVKKAAKMQKVTDFLHAASYLQALYLILKEERKKYSYRQFSSDLGFGFTNYLHLICTRERELTLNAAQTICGTLALPAGEQKYFLKIVEYEKRKDPHAREKILSEIIEIKHHSMVEDADKYMLEYLSEWYHPTIREMVTMPNFNPDPYWISSTIVPNITKEQARQSLELLERIGYIYKDENNIYRQKDINIRTGSMVAGLGIKKYHQEILNLSREALDKIEAKQRDFQALTVPMNAKLFLEIKDEINKLWRLVLERTSQCTEQESVYQMNIQLFPTARAGEKKNEKE